MAQGTWSRETPTGASASASANAGAYNNTKTTTMDPKVITTNGTQTGTSSFNESSVTNNMSPNALAALDALIAQLQGGGTTEQKVQSAKRQMALDTLNQLLGGVSTNNAMSIGQNIINMEMAKAMEQQRPAIQKSIEGSGTSGGSMQALLSQKLARDASLAAGALGAQVEQNYAQQRSNLMSTLELLTRPTNETTRSLVDALNVAKGATTSTNRSGSKTDTQTSNQVQTQSGGTITETVTPNNAIASANADLGGIVAATPTGRYFGVNSNDFWSNSRVPLADWIANTQY